MKRGANVGLTREIPGLTALVVGARFTAGAEQVLLESMVMATILCDADSRALSDDHFVFFNQITSPEMSVSQLEKALGGDTEQVDIDLGAVPAEVQRIVLIAYVNPAFAARRTLGQLRECTVRVLDLHGAELVRSENLAPALTTETALVLGEVYRHGAHWKFKVIGLGYNDGIAAVAKDFGIAL